MVAASGVARRQRWRGGGDTRDHEEMDQPSVRDVSTPGRIASPGEGIGPEELALAARNHGLPLEALRYEVTPPGLHYVLVHYDIPAADPAGWSLTVGGRVRTPLALDLAALRAFPRSPTASRWSARATAGPV